MPEIEIRPTSTEDLPTLSNIQHSYTSSHAWQLDCSLDEKDITVHFREIRLPRSVHVEYPRTLDFLTPENLDVPNSLFLTALMGELPVGYIHLMDQGTSKTVWICDLAVRELSRRKGIGSALVLAAQDWGIRKEYKRIIIEMQSKNISAIRLAKKLGYVFCGYNDHYYANQDIALFFACYLR